MKWRPWGHSLAPGSLDNLIRVWNPTDRRCLATLRGHVAGVKEISWEPNGSRLASSSVDGNVRIWQFPTTPEPLRVRDPKNQSIAVSWEGAVAIAWGDEPDALQSFDGESGSINV